MLRKIVYAWAALATAGLAAQPPAAALLEPGAAIERTLVRGGEHRYTLSLAAGEYAGIIVDQRGIDVVGRVLGPDNHVVAEFQDDMRSRGREQIELVADAARAYTIAVTAAPGSVSPGGYSIRLAVRRPSLEADRSMYEARRLRTSAARSASTAKFEPARLLLEGAVTMTESARGANDVQTAAVVAQLAGVYRRLPDSAKAEELYQRALRIFDGTLGPEHPTTAVVRSQLADLYRHTGERRKAEALLRDSLEVIEKTLGPEHPCFVRCLTMLGNLRDDAGDLEAEEQVIRRAMTILERTDQTDTVQYAELLNNRGELYRQKQDYARAETLLLRSLALSETLLGPEHYSVATALQNLGIVARERKDYATAIEYNTRALSIRERIVGIDHPDVAHILTNLANIYRATGDYSKALDTHLRALRIWENAAGPYQQATLLSVGNIAKTFAASGDVQNAVAYQRRSEEIVEKELALNLAVGSERQKLAFVKSVSERTDRTISLHLDQAPRDSQAAALAALVLLQRKGRVLDAMADTFAAIRQRVADEADQKLLDELKNTTAQLARVALSAPENAADERQKTIKALEADKERLEAALSEHSAELRAQMQPVTIAAVQGALPDDAALLEFAIFRPFDPKAERNAEAYAAPHYAVYIVRKQMPPRGIDLGPARAIDDAAAAFRQALRDPARSDVQDRGRALYECVLRPLRAWLGDVRRLLISPDGELNLVPFEALVDDDGRYLVSRYATSYLTSGRDLLRMRVPHASGGPPVIFADPLFGEPPGTAATRPKVVSRVARRGTAIGEDLATVYFSPLAATAEEAREIKTLFPEATVLTGRAATKSALQRVVAPSILHIASHGFFLRDANTEPPEQSGAPASGTRAMAAAVKVPNPLLRSGLALAGANLNGDAKDDGILTALEASSLNLWGTKLVTLSACDTGVGEVRNGEGVYGLRRAFVLAGTETLVMSLWPVSDYIARETMSAYYAGLRDGLGRGDALRQAKLALLNRRARRHPFYWASFIQSGEWASLDGQR